MFKGVTDTVKKLFWINVCAFILTGLLMLFGINIEVDFALYNYRLDNFHFYQLITHMFLHGGLLHILFNMIGLVTIAPLVESYYGKNKFLLFYLFSGLGAAFAQMFFVDSPIPMVGASGALFGMFMIYAILSPNSKLMIIPIPIGIKAKYLISFFLGLEFLLFILNPNDHVAHMAHIGGALTGAALYLLDRKTVLLNNI